MGERKRYGEPHRVSDGEGKSERERERKLESESTRGRKK